MTLEYLKRFLVWVSGGALLVAMLVDTLAMFGRQLAIPLLGSIELVQTAALIAASGALIVATIERAHARVNLLLERMPSVMRRRVAMLHWLVAALFFAALLTGTVWIAVDLWGSHEESELLRIPYRPLRVTVAVALGILLIIALRRVRDREPR